MPQKLLIVGAGGFGRELLQWSRDAGLDEGDWRLAGFLDDDPQTGTTRLTGLPVIGAIRDYEPREDERLICGLGMPRSKWDCVRALTARGARFKSVIHPTALVGQNVRLGTGCVVCPRVVLTADIEVGDFAMLNCFSSVGHDGVVGAWSTLSGYASMSGKTNLGVGGFLGSHAVLLPGVRVGAWATVGAGSVAWRSVPPGVTVLGVPARPIWSDEARADARDSSGIPSTEA